MRGHHENKVVVKDQVTGALLWMRPTTARIHAHAHKQRSHARTHARIHARAHPPPSLTLIHLLPPPPTGRGASPAVCTMELFIDDFEGFRVLKQP